MFSDMTQLRRVWIRRIGLLALAACGFVFVLPAAIAFRGSAFLKETLPRYSNTRLKHVRADAMRGYAPALDSSIAPIEAGRALYSLSMSGKKPKSPELLPTARGPFVLPKPAAGVFATAGKVWSGPTPTGLMDSAATGFTKAQLAYLDSLAAHPIWKEVELVARAPRMDLAGAAYATPFRDGYSPAALPILSFFPLKEAAYANTARAAWHLANKRPAEAERTLRTTIGFGLRLMDDGTTLIDELVGGLIVAIGAQALEDLYRVTKNPEVARVVAARTGPVAPRDTAAVYTVSEGALLQAIADPAMSHGLRFELAYAASMASCASYTELLSGHSKERLDALTRARELYARTPGERAVFDLTITAPDRPIESWVNSNWLHRALIASASVPAKVFRNPRIANCAVTVLNVNSFG